MYIKELKISFIVILFLSIVSCHSEKKVYESGDNSGKPKRFEVTIGKFNKLVKSSDMDAKYAAQQNHPHRRCYRRAFEFCYAPRDR